MTKKLLITSLLFSLCVTTAFAAGSAEKVYKISVTMPEHIGWQTQSPVTEAKTKAALKQGETTEQIVLAGNNHEILLKTTVVK